MPQFIGKMGTYTSKSDAEDPMRIHSKCCKQVRENLAAASTAVAVIIDPSFLKQGKTGTECAAQGQTASSQPKAARSTIDCPLQGYCFSGGN